MVTRARRLLFLLALVTALVLPLPMAGAQTESTTEIARPTEATSEPGVASEAAAAESVRGVIRDRSGEEDVGVPEVEIVVRTADGAEVGRAVTDGAGEFFLGLPGPGSYEAELLADTLPADFVLRNPDRNPLSFDIGSSQSRPLLFPIVPADGEGGGGGRTELDRVLQLTVEGLKFGLVIAITSIGLSLIFGTTGLVNFAHGELVTLGAFIAYTLNVRVGWHLLLAAPLAIVLGGLVGGGMDLGLWRPLRRRGTGLVSMLVVSIGLSIFLRYAILFEFGGPSRPYADYVAQRAIAIGPITIAPKDLVIMGISIAVLVGVGLMLTHTRIGKAMRAVSDNRDLAESSGIDVQRVILFVWVLGGALATLGGIFQGIAEQISWLMGFRLLLLMFAGVILGGLGTAFGALVGSLIVGLLFQLSTLVVPIDLRAVPAFLLLILVLLFRPQGILGRRERVG